MTDPLEAARARVARIARDAAAAAERGDPDAAASLFEALLALDWQSPAAMSVELAGDALDAIIPLLPLGDFTAQTAA